MSKNTKTDMNGVLPKMDFIVKKWIYDHPEILYKKDFEKECPCASLIGRWRFNDVRRRIMAVVTDDERERFATKSTYGKVREDTKRIQKWIRSHWPYNFKQFQNKFKFSGNREQLAFANRITERRFKKVKSDMRRAGTFKIPPPHNPNLFDEDNV